MKYADARHSKDSFVAYPEDNRGIFKGNEAWLIENLNGRYSGRYGGYVLPNSKRQFLERLVEDKWEGEFRLLGKSPARLTSPDGRTMTPAQAKKELLHS